MTPYYTPYAKVCRVRSLSKQGARTMAIAADVKIDKGTVNRILSGEYTASRTKRHPVQRKRPKQIAIYMTATEHRVLLDEAATEGMSIQDYVHRAVFGGSCG